MKEGNWINQIIDEATREVHARPAWMRRPEMRAPQPQPKNWLGEVLEAAEEHTKDWPAWKLARESGSAQHSAPTSDAKAVSNFASTGARILEL